MLLFDPTVKIVVYAGNTATEITGLDIEFEIVASTDSAPNTAHVTVYNLGPRLRSLFSERFQGLEVWAGYDGETKMIFRGTIANVSHSQVRPDWTTEIWAGDGQKELTDTYISESFKKGTKISKIISKIAQMSGLPTAIDEPLFDDTILAGVSYAGKLKSVLDEVCRDYGFTWSIQFGVLEVIVEGQFLSRAPTAVQLTPDSGLLEPPTIFQYEERPAAKQPEGSVPQLLTAVRISSLINPDIIPGRLIEIQSATVNTEYLYPFGGQGDEEKIKQLANATPVPSSADGVYFCRSVRYNGNNYGGDFRVEIEADKL